MTSRIRIETPQDFSAQSVIRSHGWVMLPPFDLDPDTGALGVVLRLDPSRVVEVTLRETSRAIILSCPGELSANERRELRAVFRWMLSLDLDLSDFYRAVRKEPRLAHVPQRGLGRLLRCPTLFEDAVKIILTTNTAWSGTIRMAQALVSHYGSSLPADPRRRTFPTPDQLAAIDPERLRTEGGLGYRAPYVAALAQRVASGQLDLESLKSARLTTEELRREFRAIKGVGDYAAASLLMLLGRSDFIPVDSWALSCVSREWHDGRPVGKKEVEAAFESWGPYKGLAYWFWDWTHRKSPT